MNNKYSTLGFDKVYVINLKRREDRKIELLNKYPNVDFTFIEAIDGKQVTIEQLIKENKVHTSFFDPNGIVTMGVFACALSHKKAWEQALKDGVNNALFLEDDVYFHEPLLTSNGFTNKYQNILTEINQYDYDIIQLGKKEDSSIGINVGEYLTIPRFNTSYNGAQAYVATKETLKDLISGATPIKYAADVYIQKFLKTHNVFNLKTSLIRQISDLTDSQSSDSDTYYNDYREGGGKVGISFDEKGNIINKQIAKYLKHPPEMMHQYVELVLGRPKFGKQKFKVNNGKNKNLFGIVKLLDYISNNISVGSKMIEINPHLGENTFFFGSSNLFSHIYTIDPYKGEDSFNIENNITWEDIKIGSHSNTYFFEDIINHIEQTPENSIQLFEDQSVSFLYINNRKKENIGELIKLYLPKLKQEGYIGGDTQTDSLPNSITFEDGSWIIKREDVRDI